MEIKVGCCGFPIKKEKYFEEFEIVEIQSTFYQIPEKDSTIKRWREKAPESFEFVLKAWQIITHEIKSPTYKRLKRKFGNEKNYGSFKNTREVFFAWERTKRVAEILRAKLILFQCPRSFSQNSENEKNLQRFFEKIKTKKFIFALELRGKWEKNFLKRFFKKFNSVHCVDPFKKEPVFGKINYFRLHGKPGYNLRYKYTKEDLKELLKFCDKKENYVFFNNLNMLEDAKKFKKLCQKF